MPRTRSIFYGAMLLTAASIVMRVVQMIFQVYISGVMGAAGLGRLQLVATVGGLAAVLGSGGVRIAATCLAAEESGRENPPGVRAAVLCCMGYGLVLSVLTGLGLFVLADFAAAQWVEDPAAALPLRIFAVNLPITCLTSVLAGYYTAAGRIRELVALEFGERLLSIALVVALLRSAVRLDACTVLFLASALSGAACFAVLLLRVRQFMAGVTASPLTPMLRRLLHLTVPLGLNDCLRGGLSALEHVLVPKGLRRGGASSEEAIASYGTICGMAFPVITFPSVILYSLSDLLVPELARCRAKGRSARIRALAEKCLRLTMLYAACVAGLLLCLGSQLGALLYGSAAAGTYIQVFAPVLVLLYLDAIVDGMLKGLSQQLHTVRYNTLTSLLDVCFLWFLLPRWGLGGFVCSFTVTHAVNFFLSFRRLIQVTGFLPRFRTTLCAAASCAAALLCVQLWTRWFPGETVWDTILRGGLFLCVYSGLVRLTGGLTGPDVAWLRGLAKRGNAR